MKKVLLLLGAVLLLYGNSLTAQPSTNINIQFYHDLNNNCVQESGEPLLYNIPAITQMTYMTAGSTLAMSSTSAGICPVQHWLNNANSVATNTLSVNIITPGFSVNSACAAGLTNLAYAPAVNYVPIQSVSVFGPVSYQMGGTIYPGGTSNTFPVCSTIGNDTVSFNFRVYNLWACTTGVSPRTYTLELDGVQMEHITATGNVWTTGTYMGTSGNGHLFEMYWAPYADLKFTTKFPSAINTLGTHTLVIKSSPVYNSVASAIQYTCYLTTSPCTNISGKFYSDCNNNCSFDAGDSPLHYGVQGLLYNTGASYSLNFQPDIYGNFSLVVPTSLSLSLTQYPVPVPGSSSLYTACVTGTSSLPAGASTNSLLYGYKTTPYYDPSVLMHRSSGGSTNPGTSIKYSVYTNTGTSVYNCGGSTPANPGTMKVVIPDFMTYTGMAVGSAPTVISAATGDTLLWSLSNVFAPNLHQFSVSISSTISLLTPFVLKAYVFPSLDNNPANNLCVVSGTVGAPYDPNSKEAYASGIKSNGDIPNTTKEVFYTIHFQNIGTAPAVNVKTIDTIDVNFDLASLTILQSSFPCQMQAEQGSRQVGFFFTNINLPDATTNEPGSHGWVRYSIKLKNGTPTGTVLKNRAHNYFDFTEPVATNQTVNKLVASVGLTEQELQKAVSIMPNPAIDQVLISSDYAIHSVKIYNQLGQLVRASGSSDGQVQISLQELNSGVYMVNVELASGDVLSSKLIKN